MLSSAVVVPVVQAASATLVVVRRAVHLRRNPDQLAFPGGLRDPRDVDLRATALREFEEELGLPAARARIVAALDPVVTLAGTVEIAPFVAVLAPPVRFAPNDEIAAVHEIPLDAIYAPDAVHEGDEPVVHEGATVLVPSVLFDHGALHVWGATARILHAFIARFPEPGALRALA
ncbi:MAG: NUDIX hydrolase [Candidatus Dormibacteria bacterium]